MGIDDIRGIERLSTIEYVDALNRVTPTEREWEILAAHMAAPRRTATVREIASTLGFPNWNTTNLLYGNFAGRLCKALNLSPKTKLSVLVTFLKLPGGEHELCLRPAVVAALKEIGVSPELLSLKKEVTPIAMQLEVKTKKAFHIVQAGVENGDLAWLQGAAVSGDASQSWIVPKSARPGDEIVIFTRSLGFVATATVMQEATKREDWTNRYGASIGQVRLISPPISLAYIRSRIPDLTWAIYPRSITTPGESIAEKIRNLISTRRMSGVEDLEDKVLAEANIQELRMLAMKGAGSGGRVISSERQYHIRSLAIRRYALARSGGVCEFCDEEAPFVTLEGEPYLEVHHILQLSDDGPDDPRNVIALCPNCHRRAHYSAEASELVIKLQSIVNELEKGS